MIDIHTHILPHMDDGSESLAESLAMLEASAAQGITCLAATPHFYAAENSPAEFLERRRAAVSRLRTVWRPGLPEVKQGAEVCYFEGISQSEELELLRVEDTKVLLLELPFATWTERQLREVQDLAERPEVTVLLAHIERYLKRQKREVWDWLLERGVLFQCNAEFFLRWQTRRKALGMLRAGKIHLLGSDCHGMDRRPPRLGEALAVLREDDRQKLQENARKLLPGWEAKVR